MYQRTSGLTKIVIFLCDIICITMSLRIADLIWDNKLGNGRGSFISFLIILYGVYLLAFLFVKTVGSFYLRGYLIELWIVIKITAIIVLGTSVVLVFVKISNNYSRMVFALFAVINVIVMWAVHTFLKKFLPYMYEKVVVKRRTIVVGSADFIKDICDEIKIVKDYSTELIGMCVVDDESLEEIEGIHRIASVDGLTEFCRTASVDEVVVEVNRANRAVLMPIIDEIASAGIVIRHRSKLPTLSSVSCQSVAQAGEYVVATFATRTVSTGNLIVKRTFDIFAGLVGTIVTLLLSIIIAPAIRIESKGPILFSQKRVGRNGRIFTIYKFRSMYEDAEERKAELMKHNELDGLVFKMENDPRITKVGKFLRKTSLDEFPQFINVLKGDMSMVGTRPPTLDEFEQYNLEQKGRLSFRPGLTGLWQVSGRNDITNFDDIVALDKEYIKNWSPLYDIKILLKTIPALFAGR